jgi:integrase/recombinase XerD
MRALQINDLTTKVEKVENSPISTFFEPSMPSVASSIRSEEQIPKVVEVEQGRDTPKKSNSFTITTVYEQWLIRRETQNDPKNKRAQDQRHAFKIWLRFLKEALPQEISKKTLEQYKTWLFEQRNEEGWYLKPFCILRYLQHLRSSLECMRKEGFLASNPLRPFCENAVLEEMKTRHSERRKGWVRERQGQYSDKELLRRFLEHGRREYSKTYNKDIERVSQCLEEYSKQKNKALFSLSESELDVLRRRWFDMELYPSIRVSDAVLVKWSYCLRLFYRWGFEEGHHDSYIVEHWNQSQITVFIQAERERREEEIQTKARHYSLKEILRAYGRYLKETYENYGDWKMFLDHFRHFLRFLIGKGESVYTVTEESVEAYKQGLFHHEHQPGRFYTPYFQAERIRGVKRFFDWFNVKGYSTKHPLKRYGMETYRRQIEALCLERESKRPKSQELTQAFDRIYQSIEAHERTLGLSQGALYNHRRGWKEFFHYLEKIAIKKMEEVDEEVLNDYQSYLYKSRNEDRPLSIHTRIRHLISVKRLFAYLARFKMLPRDPSACIDLPKNPRGLPTSGMNDREVRQLLQTKEPKTWKEIRDRTILETLYSTGVRSNELKTLRVQDLDFVMGLLRVNFPKGGAHYQRVIPIGRTALSWIQKYRQEARKSWTAEEDTLFLTRQGKPMSKIMVLNIVKNYLFKSGIRKKIVTHSFRVSCATEMLKNKADIKFVQQQLGHVSIGSTEKYLRLVPSDLKKVHSKTHPRERWNREEAPCPEAL